MIACEVDEIVSVPHVDEQQIPTQDRHLQQTVEEEMDEFAPKIQRNLRVRDTVHVKQQKQPKVVYRIGYGYLQGNVRVSLSTENTSFLTVDIRKDLYAISRMFFFSERRGACLGLTH